MRPAGFNLLTSSFSILLFIAAGSVTVGKASASAGAPVDSLIASGDELLSKGKLEAAAESFKQAVLADGKSSRAHQRFGLALSLQGHMTEAVAEESTAVSLDSDNAEAHANLGYIFGLQKQYGQAIIEEKAAIAIDGKNAPAYSVLGLSLASLNKYDEAVRAFNSAIELDGDNVSYRLNLAAVLGRQHEFVKAVEVYKKALALDDKAVPAYLGLGAAYGKLGKTQEELAAYRKAAALAPNSPIAHGKLGFALSRAGDLPGAFNEGMLANTLRLKGSWNAFFGMFVTVWAAVFILSGIIFGVIFFGSRFEPQEGETVLKTFFLTFYKDKPGRFVITNRRLVFVPEAFSQWFGSTRVSMELDQIEKIEPDSTISGGMLAVLYSDNSVHQFTMPNLVLEPLKAELERLHLTGPDGNANGASSDSDQALNRELKGTNSSHINSNQTDGTENPNQGENQDDDKDAIVETVADFRPGNQNESNKEANSESDSTQASDLNQTPSGAADKSKAESAPESQAETETESRSDLSDTQ